MCRWNPFHRLHQKLNLILERLINMPTQTDLDNALNNLKQTIADTAARVIAKINALQNSNPDFSAELQSISDDMAALQAIAPDAPQAEKTGGFDQPVSPGVAEKNLRETGDPLTPADPNAAQTADVSSSSTVLPGKTAAQGDVAAVNWMDEARAKAITGEPQTTTSGSAPGNSATTAGGGFAVDANGSPADSDGTGEEAGSEQAAGTAASTTTATTAGDK